MEEIHSDPIEDFNEKYYEQSLCDELDSWSYPFTACMWRSNGMTITQKICF